jgi:hypothetical protein
MGRFAWLGAWIATAACAGGPLISVPAHRLNRAEYNNTVRDLIGVNLKLAADLPPDDSGYGFDNIGDVLTLSPVLMERYFAAADRITRNPDFQKRLLVCEAQRLEQPGCARQILSAFASRAYRRPVTPEEVDRLMRFVDQAQQEGVRSTTAFFSLCGPCWYLRIFYCGSSATPVGTSSSPAGFPIFCGAACRMTNCFKSRKTAVCGSRASWRHRCGGCLPIRNRTRWCKISAASGWSFAISTKRGPTGSYSPGDRPVL